MRSAYPRASANADGAERVARAQLRYIDFKAAIVAFKQHFVQRDLSPELTDRDRRLLHRLLERKWR
jgi:hypothetical protein